MATVEKQRALEFIKPKVPSIKKRILNTLQKAPKGLTSKEICAYLNVKIQTVAGRLDELQDAGDVYGIDLQGRAETKYIATESSELKRKLALNRSQEKFFQDLRKWKKRYSDILSEKTFEWIEFEAKENFKNRTHVK